MITMKSMRNEYKRLGLKQGFRSWVRSKDLDLVAKRRKVAMVGKWLSPKLEEILDA